MKKIQLLVALSFLSLAIACNKHNSDCKKEPANYNTVARTVDGISFSGETAWLKFGTRDYIEASWECTSSYDFCQYQYTSPEGHVVTAGEATGEIGYSNDVLHIALDVSSMADDDKRIIYTRDGEFHWGSDGYYTTSGFDIKNLDDANQNTIGDIHVDAGTYPVYEDEDSILIVFEEVE